MWPGARTPPTEFLNSVSPVNTSVPSTSSESMPRVWPGVWIAWTVSAADLELVAGVQIAGGAVDQLALVGVDQHLRVREAVA